MDDQQESPLIDMARGIYKGANDLINKIPSFSPKPDAHQQAIDEMNKQANDRWVQDTNKTYIHPTQTAAQKKSTPAPTPGKIMTKASPRKR